jgi:N-acetylmuramoyl-L-alanine amidase
MSDLFFLKQHVEKNMSTTTPHRLLKKSRIMLISLTSLILFFSVTGFIPLSARNIDNHPLDKDDTLSQNFSYSTDFNSFVSHNLTLDMDELRCLALNIYFESRSEPLDGQLAVAGVTLNRVQNERFPNTICDVVKQGSEARLHRCQFSWWCDGQIDQPKELKAWRNAQQVARLFMVGVYNDPTDHALWYHADYVQPQWATTMQQTARIGHHLFFKAEPKPSSKPMS